MQQANQPEIVGVDSWVAPVDFEQSIPSRFERQVQHHRCRTAIVSDTWQPTYEKLHHASNRLAHALLARAGAPGDRVALLLPHDSPLIAGVLGVLKAARIVVVLNPADPRARLQQVLLDAQSRLILTDNQHSELAGQVAAKSHTVLCIDEFLAGGPAEAPEADIGPGDAAFLVYTSGSTANPKGVIRSHRNILHNSFRHSCGLRVQPEDRLLMLAALSTGSGVTFTFTSLLNGSTLCPFNVSERGVTHLADWIQNQGITVYSSSSSLFRHFMRVIPGSRRFPRVRIVRLSSEPATADDYAAVRRHFADQCEMIHTLSSSETGNIARAHLTARNLDGRQLLPVGQAVEDVEVLLLNERGGPVPRGEIGEITVRSRYLASGYWRDETLTAAKFSVNGDIITFRSGDLGRINSDGLLEFAGRNDARVKIRGFRIEPSEVETALRRQPAIAEAAVCQRTRKNGDDQLVAYLTCHGKQTPVAAELRAALREILPPHMIPTDFVFLDAMPISSNGKIDRQQLRTIHASRGKVQLRSRPATSTERLLGEIWADVFRRETIGREDDFFELGGDSLMAAVVAANIHAKLGVEITLRTFSDKPSLRALAKAIDGKRKRKTALPLPTVPRTQPLPLSFAQEMIWRVGQTPEGLASYVMAGSYRLRGELNADVLHDCMRHMVERHEILRTTFEARSGTPVAIVHASTELELPVLDFSMRDNPRRDATDFLRERIRNDPFDLGRLPLMRLWLVRLNEREHWLLRAHHHILSDGWSWKVYFNELACLYDARLRGTACQLADAPQYADFAAWQRNSMNVTSRKYRRSIAWWRKQFSPRPAGLALPFPRSQPCPLARPQDGIISFPTDADVSRRLDLIAAHNGATYFAVRCAVFAAALGAATGQQDLVIGAYATGRTRLDLQSMFGMFANLVTLRLRWNPKQSFVRWLRHVTRSVTAAQQHSELPHNLLCETLSEQGFEPPEIQAIFSVSDQNAPQSFGGVELTRVDRRKETMPWGFSMKLDQHNDDLCHTEFDARRYDPSGVRAFLDRYVGLLDAVSRYPNRPLTESIRAARSFDRFDGRNTFLDAA